MNLVIHYIPVYTENVPKVRTDITSYLFHYLQTCHRIVIALCIKRLRNNKTAPDVSHCNDLLWSPGNCIWDGEVEKISESAEFYKEPSSLLYSMKSSGI